MVRCGSLESIVLVRLGHFVFLGGKPACEHARYICCAVNFNRHRALSTFAGAGPLPRL